MGCLWVPLPRMRRRPPRFIVGGMRKSPGLFQPRETQTLHVPTFQWLKNYLNDCFHRWQCASGSHKDYLLPCSIGILLQDLNRLYLWISNTVAYRDPQNSSLAIGQGQVYMPNKCSWGMFKVPFLINRCLDNQFSNASFDLQRLKLLILFTVHTSMPYDRWEWKIDHRLKKSTRHLLPSPQRPSTIVCRPGKQACLGCRQSVVQEVEHNVSAIQETLIMRLRMHAQMYFVIPTQIFVLPRQKFKPIRLTISAAWSTKGSTQLVQTHWWHNLTTIRAALMRTSMIMSRRSSWSSPTILLIFSAALLLLLKLVCDSQLFCQPSPGAGSPPPAATATATATATTSPTWRVLGICD